MKKPLNPLKEAAAQNNGKCSSDSRKLSNAAEVLTQHVFEHEYLNVCLGATCQVIDVENAKRSAFSTSITKRQVPSLVVADAP